MDINTVIADYIRAKQEKAAAEKREKELKALLLSIAGGRESFETDNFTVIVKTSASMRLDTDALYKDFPDIKKEYGRVSTSTSIIAAEKETSAEKKSA